MDEHRTKPVTFIDQTTGQPFAESHTMKLFRPETFDLLSAFKDRLGVLPPYILRGLEAKWKPNERSIQISAFKESGQESFFMPQTKEDEDDLVLQLKQQMADIEDEITKLQYAHSPAHVVAFEQQLLAYRANSAVQRAFPNKPGALQDATITALKAATTYCWSPTCVEAVAEKANLLPPDAMPADLPLGEVMAPAACGWWWFEKPIPAKTTTSGEPIVALLWRRELRHVTDDLREEQTRVEAERLMGTGDAVSTAISRLGRAVDRAASGGVYSRTWFNAFIMESVVLGGRPTLVPSPTLAWVWIDGMPISELLPTMVTRFGELDRQGRAGVDALSSAESAETAVWLSKFWMAGGLWLDSRVTASGKRRPSMLAKVTTALPRQQARRLARLHHLGTLPTVEVVYLRRSEPREADGPGAGRTRDHEYCWLVKEFPRRQWFPSLGRHQLIMVAEHIRGPKDRPLKHAKRIYAVNR